MQTRRGPEEWFTGVVWMDASPAGPSPDASVFRVFFEPGARRNWDTHPEGRIPLVPSAPCPSPGASVFRVFFEPGARTNWHTPPEGQILFVLTGSCRVAREGEPPVDVEAGGAVPFAPERSR